MTESSSFRRHARGWTIVVASAVGIAVVVGGYGLWRSAGGGAVSVVYEGPGFVVSLPGTPTEEVTSPPGPTGPMEGHSLVLNPENDEVSYRLDYLDYPPGLLAGIVALGGGQTPDWTLAGARNLASELAGTVASELSLSLDGHPGTEVTIERPEGRTTIARIYLVEHRLYRLMVTTPSEQASRKETREFLDSFELVEPSSSEGDPGV